MPILEYDLESQLYGGSSSSDAFYHQKDTPIVQEPLVEQKPAQMVIEGKYEDSETYTEKEFSELDKFSLQENNTLEVVPSKV